jgi:hypothetical protein
VSVCVCVCVCVCMHWPEHARGLSIHLSIDTDVCWALTAARGRARQRIDTLEAHLQKYVQSGRESSTEAQGQARECENGVAGPDPAHPGDRRGERALVIVLGLQRGNSAAWASLVRQQYLKSPLYSGFV